MIAVPWFKALADATRLRILGLTLNQELNVQELVEILAMGQSRVSRHLKILADAGLLTSRRDGLWAFYRVPAAGPGHSVLAAAAPLFTGDAEVARDRERAAELMAAGRGRARRFFDTLAPEWDRRKRELLGDTDLEGLLLAGLPRAATAADLGCGTGTLLARLAARVSKAIGVDASPRMLEMARRSCAGCGEGVEFRLGELEHLPLRDAEVGAAVLNLVLHHLRTPLSGLQEAHRVLEPGGTLVLAELSRHQDEELRTLFGDRWLGFTAGELESWLREAGFDITGRKEQPLSRGLSNLIFTARRKQ